VRLPRGPVCLALLLLFAIAPLPAAPAARFTHFSVEQGLSQSTVNAILQDHLGFMWFGTEEGLDRFDGYTLVSFKRKAHDPHSLPGDHIWALCEDRAHRIWVGTDDGLCFYDRHTKTFNPIPEIQTRAIRVIEDADGVLWIATEGAGLFERNPATGTFTRHLPDPAKPGSLASANLSALLLDSQGRLWVGTRSRGLDRFDQATGKFIHHRHDPKNPKSLGHDGIRDLAEDGDGNIWVATEAGGLSVRNPRSGLFRNYRYQVNDPGSLPTNRITRVLVDRSGVVWLGTDGAGLAKYDSINDRFIAFAHDAAIPSSLSQDTVRSLYEDDQGHLWIGTFLGGIDLLNRPRPSCSYFTHVNSDPSSLADRMVASLLEDRQGRIWVGMEHGALDRFDADTSTFTHYRYPSNAPGGAAILALHQDRQGRIWVGTYHGGLARFDPDTGAFTVLAELPGEPVDLTEDAIWSIAESPDGMLWLGTNSAVDQFDPKTETVVRRFPSFNREGGPAGVPALAFDREGNLWAGTYGGLKLLPPGASHFTDFRHDDHDLHSLSNDGVISLYLDPQDRLWVGTYGGGLNLFNRATKTFTAHDDFPSNVIYRIEAGAAGQLWVSTNNGLARFDPATGTAEDFELMDGLRRVQFHAGSSLHTRAGELLFGSLDGLYKFKPAALRLSDFAPPIVLTSVRVFAEPMALPVPFSSLETLALDPADKVFSLEFAALDYTFPRRNHYAYQLEGFSDRWLQLGDRREVTLTNLDPGHYVFRVKASNSDGVWSPGAGLSLSLTVLPPFWATWWFRAAAVAMCCLLLLALHRLRIRRLTADLAERRRAELALRHAEEKYRELVEDIHDVIFSADANGIVTYISPVVEPVLGYQPADLLGRPFVPLLTVDDPTAALARLQQTGTEPDEPLECRIVTKSGQTRWIRISSRPIPSESGSAGFRGVITDITEHKKLELQFQQSQKMEAIGQLAGGIAHDFNNILTGIIGYSALLLDDPAIDADLRGSLGEIRDAGQRAASLTRQLLAFSRRQMLQPRAVNLNQLVADIDKMLRRQIGEDIHLALALEPGLASVRADPGQLEQVIMNLAVNARDAMPRGGRLALETSSTRLDKHYTQNLVGVPPGPYIRLAVSDTGCGMDAETQAHIFEPFFTTKGVGQGTGLGLSTVYGIIKQSNGHIAAYSEPGVGTTFKIYLPPVHEPGEPAPHPEESGELPAGTETILLVEDNDIARKIAQKILEQYGYTVLVADDGAAAVHLCDAHAGKIHLMLTDVVMPNMSGTELAAHVAVIRP
jgi:PAS domain S-box-containing protein